MSASSTREYLESCRARYGRRNREGRGRMIDEVCETFGWSRKHAIKALNGRAGPGTGTGRRGRGRTYGEEEARVVVAIWRLAEQPCGKLLKPALKLWLPFYEQHHGALEEEVRQRVESISARQIDRLTGAHRVSGGRGRRTGRSSHRLKQSVPVRCGPWSVGEPGWMEADTVAHGGGSSHGEFAHTLTLTDIHSGWTALRAQWCLSAGGVIGSLESVAAALPFGLQGFDSDNGAEFLNEVLEKWLSGRRVHWTRSRPYKKNDQAHVEQKNYTHVRQLVGYGRIGDIDQIAALNRLYEEAWMPLRNHFTPVMKLVEKRREGGRWKKCYDEPRTPCERLLASGRLDEEGVRRLEKFHAELDPIELAARVETGLAELWAGREVLAEDPETAPPVPAPAPVAPLPAPARGPAEQADGKPNRRVS